LKLSCDKLPSSFAFKTKLRCYTSAWFAAAAVAQGTALLIVLSQGAALASRSMAAAAGAAAPGADYALCFTLASLLGFGDGVWNTQISSLIGSMYPSRNIPRVPVKVHTIYRRYSTRRAPGHKTHRARTRGTASSAAAVGFTAWRVTQGGVVQVDPARTPED
jgi:hypothetical protein